MLAVRPQEQLQKNRERLVGKWSAIFRENPRRVSVYEFRADGDFALTMSDGDGRSITEQGTWKVLGGKGNTLRVLMSVGGLNDEKDVELRSGGRFRYTTKDGTIINATRAP